MASRLNSWSPRERSKPLIPEPFARLSISRQSVFLQSTPMAQRNCKFSPVLEIPQYRDQLSEEKKTELDERAGRLSRRACQNQLYEASEFCWEVDAWHDVFGPIRDDERCRIDKRPYEFAEKDEHGNTSVKRRVPDATMGLKSYDEFDFDNGYRCTVSGCKIDHATMQPHQALSQDRIFAQMFSQECGLMVDGIWGKADVIFPFGVYEAKKKSMTFEQAESQIYHACRTYLAMMDDLARDPEDLKRYQFEDSERYQLFCFTSSGPYWEVYVAWHFLGGCHVETIWEGSIVEFSRAYDLICIVDQIHDYAVSEHRDFVIKHLEAWLSRAEEFESAQIETPNLDSFEGCEESKEYVPDWRCIKEVSKQAVMAKAALTRKRKRAGKELEDASRVEAIRAQQTSQGAGSSQKLTDVQVQPKRGRGRPKKVNVKST